MISVGADVGGTYTDLVLVGEDGALTTHKVPSTPDDPARAVLEGLGDLDVRFQDAALVAHGTTVATNAVIQRAGAVTGLLTTRGFRDVLQIRRTTRGALYDLQWDPPPELVPRELRREIAERTSAKGEVLVAADIEGALAQTAELVREGIRSLAICFINSYLNPVNEIAVRDAVRSAYPDLAVFASSELLPEWREFERTSTTVVNAYVAPVLDRYIRGLAREVRTRGYRHDLMVMSSNGGLATAEATLSAPAHTLLSGPAAGVMAQLALLRAVGVEDAIGVDIGGTSTDVSILHAGRPRMRTEFDLEFGTTVSYPVIDITAIGAGGGTIGWVDRGGMLHVGPQSAGAIPGPACLERGGLEPTITDANVALHRLNPRHLLGGRVPISETAAVDALARVGGSLGLDAAEMASGMLTLAVSNIAFAIRQLTVERGLDPREFVLVAYGGAGPLHAAAVAEELGISRALVPRFPGLTCALGLLHTDIRHDFVTTYLRPADESGARELDEALTRLAARGVERLADEGIAPERSSVVYSADLRYVGQTHELNVLLPSAPAEAHARLGALLRAAHLREYGHAPDLSARVEIVNLRVACIGLMERPPLPGARDVPKPGIRGERDVAFSGERLRAPVYDRQDLGRGARLEGPAIVEQIDSTTLVPLGWRAEVDDVANLRLEITG
jgi:N-methylhydantoinase A